jgi:hypothetical protein
MALRAQVFTGLERRSETFLREIFDSYKDPKTKMLHSARLHGALLATRISESDDLEYDATLVQEQIDFEEFRRILQSRSVLDQWAKSVPLWQLLSDSIPRKTRTFDFLRSSKPDRLKMISNLAAEDIEEISEAFLVGFKVLVTQHCRTLQESLRSMKAKSSKVSASKKPSEKFGFVMECGSIQDFHNGLSARLGTFFSPTVEAIAEIGLIFNIFCYVEARFTTSQLLRGHGGRALQQGRLGRRIHHNQLQHYDFSACRMEHCENWRRRETGG